MRNDGGPAFPNVPDGAGDKWSDWDHGMSLRDYFSAKAMAAFIVATTDDTEIPDNMAYKIMALMAYEMADAMLAEREKGR